MRNARAPKLQWSGPTVHSSTVTSTERYLVDDCGSFLLKTVRIIVGRKIMLGMW